MSTLKVTNIESPSGGGVNAKITDINGGQLSNRNLFVNGGARIAQRGTSETGVTSSGYKTVDQFKVGLASLGTWTVSQETDAPAGFSNSLKMDCTTADSSPAANDVCAIDTFVEAQNLQVLEYGSASAVAATLSFYVKSNKTGSGTVSILQDDNSNRCINVSYTISSANTWERKTISLPADASGVINNDNGRGFIIEYWLNSGSTYTGGSAQTDWGSLDNTNRNFANLGIGGSTDDYWMITGVQLEVGEVATAFEHRSVGDELLRCYRYYYRTNPANGAMFGTGFQYSATSVLGLISFPVPMRANVTAVEQSGTASDYGVIGSQSTVTNTAVPSYGGDANDRVLNVNFTISSGSFSTGDAVFLRSRDNDAYLGFSAEL